MSRKSTLCPLALHATSARFARDCCLFIYKNDKNSARTFLVLHQLLYVFGAAEMCMQHLHYAIEHKTPLSICRRLVLLATKSSRRPFSSGVFCAIEAMRLGPRLGASRSANSSCGGGSTNHAAARRIICANE